MLEQNVPLKRNFFEDYIKGIFIAPNEEITFQFLPPKFDITGIDIPELNSERGDLIFEIACNIHQSLPGPALFPDDKEEEKNFNNCFLNLLDKELSNQTFDIKAFLGSFEQCCLGTNTQSYLLCLQNNIYPFIIAMVEHLHSVKLDKSIDETIIIRSDILQIYRTLIKLKLKEYGDIVFEPIKQERSLTYSFLAFSTDTLPLHIRTCKLSYVIRILLAFGTAVPGNILDIITNHTLKAALGGHASNLRKSDVEEKARVKILINHLQIETSYKKAIETILALDDLTGDEKITIIPEAVEHLYSIIINSNPDKIVPRFKQCIKHLASNTLSFDFRRMLARDGRLRYIALLGSYNFTGETNEAIMEYLGNLHNHAFQTQDLTNIAYSLSMPIPDNEHTSKLKKAIAIYTTQAPVKITTVEELDYISAIITSATETELTRIQKRWDQLSYLAIQSNKDLDALARCAVAIIIADNRKIGIRDIDLSNVLNAIPTEDVVKYLGTLLKWAQNSTDQLKLAKLQTLAAYAPSNKDTALIKAEIATLAGFSIKMEPIEGDAKPENVLRYLRILLKQSQISSDGSELAELQALAAQAPDNKDTAPLKAKIAIFTGVDVEMQPMEDIAQLRKFIAEVIAAPATDMQRAERLDRLIKCCPKNSYASYIIFNTLAKSNPIDLVIKLTKNSRLLQELESTSPVPAEGEAEPRPQETEQLKDVLQCLRTLLKRAQNSKDKTELAELHTLAAYAPDNTDTEPLKAPIAILAGVAIKMQFPKTWEQVDKLITDVIILPVDKEQQIERLNRLIQFYPSCNNLALRIFNILAKSTPKEIDSVIKLAKESELIKEFKRSCPELYSLREQINSINNSKLKYLLTCEILSDSYYSPELATALTGHCETDYRWRFVFLSSMLITGISFYTNIEIQHPPGYGGILKDIFASTLISMSSTILGIILVDHYASSTCIKTVSILALIATNNLDDVGKFLIVVAAAIVENCIAKYIDKPNHIRWLQKEIEKETARETAAQQPLAT